MTAQTFTAARLVVSQFNVRTNAEDAQATAALEESIAARGLIEPLVVHPMDRSADPQWGVLAGGRRFRAIVRLIAAKRLAPDWPIPATALLLYPDTDAAAIIELSAAENILRRDLRAYEIHAAVARAAAEGASVAEIAATLGQREIVIERHLRLGRLAPEIFAAYANGKLEYEQARAYAATADVELQRAAWAHFGGADRARAANQHEIRKWLRVGDFELTRLLAFVGLAAYRAAGGAFELDLFYEGPEDRGRVADEGILRGLAERRLEELREDLRAEYALPDLRFLTGPGDASLWYEPPAFAGAGLPAPIPAEVLAHLTIEPAGKATVAWFWESKKAKAAADRALDPPRASLGEGDRAQRGGGEYAPDPIPQGAGFTTVGSHGPAAQTARAAIKDEHGLTSDGIHVIRSLRRELLRALLVTDAGRGGELGRDYLVWSQLRHAFTRDRATTIGARGLAQDWQTIEERGPAEFIAPFVAETEAHAVWEEALTRLRSWGAFTDLGPVAGLTMFLELSEDDKLLAGAVAAGLALERAMNAPGWRIATHDVLAARAGVDPATVRQLWSPTPAFMALFPKLKRLALAAPFVDAKVLREWAKKDDRTITGATAAALDPKTHSDPAIAKAAGEWVHDLLTFPSAHRSPERSRGAEEAASAKPAPAKAGVETPAPTSELEPAS